MARATFVKSAQKDIYLRGKRVEYVSQKGKRNGQTLSKIDRTIPQDENDKVFIAKGESYWWWQFLRGGKILSKTKPRSSQLTQSSFLSQLYEIQESIADFSAEIKEDFDSFKEDLLDQIENLKDECQNSLDNMPDQLQYSPTGELLQERIDALDDWYSQIEDVECDYDEEEVREEKKTEYEKDEAESEDDYIERIDQETANAIEEIVNEAVEELSGTDCGL
jgi:gas vesicle protein